MKRIYILRHAKAGQTNKKILDDHERPLTHKGVLQCEEVGEYLGATKAKIDLVVSSTSERTKQTTELVLESFGKKIQTKLSSKIYLGSHVDILNEVAALDNKKNNVLLVGHNPGLHQFAISLISSGEKSFIKALNYNFPPSSLAVIEFDKDSWDEIKWRTGKIVDFVSSKDKS